MMSLMVDLIILVICISDSASGVKKRQEQKVKFAGGDEGVKFSIFHFPYAGSIHKIHVYTRISSDTVAYAFDDKRIYLIAEDLEQKFRGSISLTVDDCTVSIILVILMIMMI